MIEVKNTYRFWLLGGQRSKHLPADAFEVAFGSPLPSTTVEKVAAEHVVAVIIVLLTCLLMFCDIKGILRREKRRIIIVFR